MQTGERSEQEARTRGADNYIREVPSKGTMAQRDTTKPPAHEKRRLERKATEARLVRQISESSLKSPMAPEYVTVEVRNEETGEVMRKKVYVTEINGAKTLDLYSGWNPDAPQSADCKTAMVLNTLPPKVCAFTNLERLWLSHNRLSSLPEAIEGLFNLKALFLHRNNFESVPVELCRLPSLEILWMNSNKITSIPEEVGQLKMLKRLHLDGNFVEEFPTAVCQLAGLEVLYFNNNYLTSVSDDIGNLRELKRLYLQNNQISSIPSGVCCLSQIEMLLLDNNKITQVRREFQHFQAQREAARAVISLKNNPFVVPPSRMKLSVGSYPHHALTVPLKTRRHSEQVDRGKLLDRRPRASLPESQISAAIQESRMVTVKR